MHSRLANSILSRLQSACTALINTFTADTDLHLGRYFGTSAQFWINLQAHYDLELAKDRLPDRLDREVKV